MARPTLDELFEDCARVIRNQCGIRAKPYQDDGVSADEAQVYHREFDSRLVFSDAANVIPAVVRVLVKRTDVRGAQKKLRDFVDPSTSTSIKAAIEDGDNWTVELDYAVVTTIGEIFEVGDTEVYLAVELDVELVW